MAVLANETAEEHCCYNQSKEESVSLFIFKAPPLFFLNISNAYKVTGMVPSTAITSSWVVFVSSKEES